MWTTLACLAVCALQPGVADNTAAMRKVEWLVGEWAGAGELSDMGKYGYDIGFEWALGRNFLKVTQTVKTAEATLWHSTGFFGWDAKKKQFVWFQFGFDGTVGWTRTKDAGEEALVVMEGRLSGGGPFSNFRTTFKKTGKDAMNNRLEFLGGKEPQLFTATDFTRQAKAAAHKAPADDAGHMKKAEWVLGSWVATWEEGSEFDDEYRFEKVQNGNFIRSEYTLRKRGKVVWQDAGMIGYDAERKKYVVLNFGMDGTIGWTEGDDPADGDCFVQEGETVGPNESLKFRATFRKVDADTMSAKMEKKEGERWVPMELERIRKRKKP